jgi:hypothetical protein
MPVLPAVWVALFTTAPTNDSGTSTAVEVNGTSYARVQAAGTAATNATTASGNATLHFAATPAWIVAGMSVRDVTTAAVIPAATTVSTTTGTTVVLSTTATGAGVGNGDSIDFSAFAPAVASSGSEPNTTPGQVVNTNTTITFPQAGSGGWGTVTSFGLFDSATATTDLLMWDYLGNFKWLPFSGTLASPSVLTSPAHGYSNNDPVVVTTKYGGTLPTTTGSWSGVLTVTNTTTDTFNVGINASASGDGQIRKIVQQSIPANVTFSFQSGQFTASLA